MPFRPSSRRLCLLQPELDCRGKCPQLVMSRFRHHRKCTTLSQGLERMCLVGRQCMREHQALKKFLQDMEHILLADRRSQQDTQLQLEVKVELEELVMLEVGLVVQEVG